MTATVQGISVDGREGGITLDRKHDFSVTYYVTTTSATDGPITVLDAAGIPETGDVYDIGGEYDQWSIVKTKRCSQRDDPREWEVVVTYETAKLMGPGGPGPSDPIDMEPQISVFTRERNIVISGQYQDPRNAKPDTGYDLGVHSSNGEHLDPPPEIEISEPVISITRNFRTIDWVFIMSMANAVNAESWWEFEPRQLRICSPKIDSATDSSIGKYWRVSYEMAYRYETWDVQFLNRGTFNINRPQSPSDPETVELFKDDEGRPFIGLLDIDGNPINKDDAEWIGRYKPDGTGDLPSFQRLRIYREVDFSTLGLL